MAENETEPTKTEETKQEAVDQADGAGAEKTDPPPSNGDEQKTE